MMGGGSVLKYGCCRASCAEIRSAGTSINIVWTRSSVLWGSWFNLIHGDTQGVMDVYKKTWSNATGPKLTCLMFTVP